jgi:hypothetical protein
MELVPLDIILFFLAILSRSAALDRILSITDALWTD